MFGILCRTNRLRPFDNDQIVTKEGPVSGKTIKCEFDKGEQTSSRLCMQNRVYFLTVVESVPGVTTSSTKGLYTLYTTSGLSSSRSCEQSPTVS